MIFSPELAEKVLARGKTVTRRRLHGSDVGVGWAGPTRYKVGRTYAVQPGRGKRHVGHILIEEVRTEELNAITDEDVQREGFLAFPSFCRYWKSLHHGFWNPREIVAVIDFTLVGRCPKCARLEEGDDLQSR